MGKFDQQQQLVSIRYYTQSLEVPSEYESLVELDSSMASVTAHRAIYTTILPLMVVSPGIGQFHTIREYICGQIVQNLTEDMQLELRWLQKFGRRANESTEATLFLDDINIRIWNGMSFLQVLSEDFNSDQMMLIEPYTLQSAVITMQRYGLGSPSDRYVEFRGSDMMSGGITRRTFKILVSPIDMFVPSEESSECKLR